MRPDLLNPLFAEATSLKGVGAGLARPLDKLGLTRVRDFLYHLPDRFVQRRAVATLDEAALGEQIIVALTVREHRQPAGRGPFRVIAEDSVGNHVSITYFGRAAYTAKKALPVGEKRWVAGRLDQYGQTWQIVHPDHVSEDSAGLQGHLTEAVYPLSEGLTQGRIASLVHQALGQAPRLPEWIEPGLLAREEWPAWHEALARTHQAPDKRAKDRLAYDELFANALALMLVRAANRNRVGQPLHGDGHLRAKLNLPFTLTGAQSRAIAEIESDMAQGSPMLRLLQGDVGSGKTAVALHAMLVAVEAGGQAALLAPTEILARQHADTLAKMARGTGVNIALLTGRDKGRAREALLMNLLDGGIDILVGTHAIFQDSVAYRNLALVVIDEQHRFGVGQRLMLTQKARRTPHCLAMTATPIPRTLTLAQYGEMEVSRLDEMPPGRQAIDTRVVAQERLPDVIDGIGRHIAAGHQAYWVCPMVREAENEDLAAAEARHAMLAERFGARVVMVHGQMRPEAKDAAMERFASGEASLLVATTVIEVGVDVPNATLMVIEQAERFGLAQLHQLRGRVGRGSQKSTCLLLRGDMVSKVGRERLALMRETQDGFLLAEEDLRLRGGGELLGTRQSGDTPFRVADFEQIANLLPIAHDDARLLMERDGGLSSPRGEAARVLLYLFERDWGVQLLRGG
ncbi:MULTISPECIES: ATP-dependent DNA helicase RecG [Novosphingobium]|uniref:ATP-dependent DNA helicase RecG n=1 Tax=Novosphingobium TaxID=165696 RepID=UPI000786AB1B|nr:MULTISPECIES: ATP-dependent DNA helicase RecG [Novosphingobium]MBB3357064.1 ATP-dependent DNA helicase RecG [Novosphingobium sp. BK256]MBB3373465.1 ATP-dependent DNA helicase RecG [Novosphingobium sp. BK280]MBB3377835.1 ATP-dependent DNA helicase RecG [Novosphingobium sp. BK258]MBB3418755.1 ATP-dependent DNA helicase RecG [Novosphingobium sp. BK267]MBB3450410.1 ATP-dependent DNA helicase RecG [Novosphingobium sp. BK352]